LAYFVREETQSRHTCALAAVMMMTSLSCKQRSLDQAVTWKGKVVMAWAGGGHLEGESCHGMGRACGERAPHAITAMIVRKKKRGMGVEGEVTLTSMACLAASRSPFEQHHCRPLRSCCAGTHTHTCTHNTTVSTHNTGRPACD
jgi:hypothetical protein